MRTAQDTIPTKVKLLEAAQQLMLTKGYPATTLDEICQVAGLTKGSFFHYFENKEDLGKAVLDHFVETMFGIVQQAEFHQKKDPLQRVYGYLDFLTKLSKDPNIPRSCLLGSFAQELSDTHPKIQTQCAKHFNQWTEDFKKDLDQAKAQHAPNAAFDTRSLSEYLITILEGSLILAKAKQERRIIERNLQHFKQYLKTLFKHTV
jgi:TetR/AcrR family transcriptional repressor of nem operon